jgi:uncharacterized protein (TIGR02246 family)
LALRVDGSVILSYSRSFDAESLRSGAGAGTVARSREVRRMSKRPGLVLVLVFVLVQTMLPRIIGARESASEEEGAIRDARARSNAAIARHDAKAIGETFMDDVTVVTSTGRSEKGKSENEAAFEEIFRARPDVVYLREPEEVALFSAWGVATERGRWKGSWTETDGRVEISGTYLAQWRKVQGRWLLQGELFVPVVCEGAAYCRQHP